MATLLNALRNFRLNYIPFCYCADRSASFLFALW